eukprot:g18838.t1
MGPQAVQWDLSSMELDELLTENTILFLAKVLAAASVVAFGPALILDYVPTAKVEVRDAVSAGSTAGRTQRLLLAFAGGGLMAEAALHLLPHLFMPHHGHDDKHPHDGHGGLGDACTLIAVGFLAAFAIDRFFSARQHQQQRAHGENNGGAETAVAHAAAETAAVHTAEALAVLRGGSDAALTEDTLPAGPAAAGSEEHDADGLGEPEPEAEAEAETETGEEEQDEPARDLAAWSTLTDDGGAAGAMLASAHMSTPDKPRPLPELTESTAEDAGEAAPPSEPDLTLYGNPKDSFSPAADEAVADAKCNGGHHHDDHHDHGPADAGAYVTLAVDFLHNLIDGIGIGAAYAVGGDAVGHATALLKLVHELQHEVGDVATLVQCGMSKHHAIHIQHTTAAGVFLGVAVSLGAGAFPEGLLAACLALSAGATFHLASGTVLGPVLAIPADGPAQGLLEVAALAAGAAGVVAVGMAEAWAGIAH